MPADPPPQPRSSRRRSRAARVALMLASTVASLALGECAFRLHARREQRASGRDDEWRRALRRMNATIYRRSSDPRLVYEPVPRSAAPMPYGVAGFNAAQMRDDREHAEVPDGGGLGGGGPRRLRVAMLGDSIVWSENVALADSLPRRTEAAMGAARAEVLNFGVTGYDTAQELAWYRRAVRRFRPDVVAVVFCLNDAVIMSGPFNRYATPDEARRKDAQDAMFARVAPVRAETIDEVSRRAESGALWQSLARARTLAAVATYDRRADYQDEFLVSFADPARLAATRASLAELGAAIAADGAQAHLFISPVLRAWGRYHWSAIHAQVAAAARAAGFVVHDPVVAWRAEGLRAESLRFPGDNLHYGPEGNRVFGRYVARALGSAAPRR